MDNAVETVPKYNRKIGELRKINTHNTHIQDPAHSWLGMDILFIF